MAKARPTVRKRQKELAKREKKEAKAARRAARQAERDDREVIDGVDPDLVGIQPGPQPEREDDPLSVL